VRYRDRGLAWREWSEGLAFTTGASALSDNLLLNPGAEDGTTHWTATLGPIESLTGSECDSVPPYAGDYLFAVGGICEGEVTDASAFQRVDVAPWSAEIDTDRATAHLGGWMRNYGSSDRPEFEIALIHENGTELARSKRLSSATGTWTEMQSSLAIPVGTRSIDFVLYGTRNAGSDNDSYFDDLSLRLLIEANGSGDDDDSAGDDDDTATAGDDDDTATAGDDDDDDDLSGGGGCGSCATLSPPQSPWQLAFLTLGGLGILRRLSRQRRSGLTPSSSSS
jgi:hypothetical protein